MRIVLLGAGRLALATAKHLIGQNHEVIIIEQDKEKIDTLAENLDCGFLHGDGSTPEVLKETDPKDSDFLFCLTGNDQINIIASLVGRSLGFSKVVTKIENSQLDHICKELGLENTIIPNQAIGRNLSDFVKGRDVADPSTFIKDDARLFSFIIGNDDDGKDLQGLKLPKNAKVICYYRQGKFKMAEDISKLQEGDEIVMLTHSDNLDELKKRWSTESDSKKAYNKENESVNGTEKLK